MMAEAWYNEIDPFAAQWLRNLIDAQQIMKGTVDERPIETLRPCNVGGVRSHFFAGIGGWDLALQLAGWPEDLPVWTGSCPCQPFSVAGRRKGSDDPRHLWPTWYALICECRPPVIFGEQVTSRAGREWLAGVRADLEVLGYAVGCADLCAAGVGALHRRQRLWWVADTDSRGLQREREKKKESWSWEQLAGLVQAETRVAISTGKDSALADGISGRVGRLRAYGNAIVPQVGAEFVRAFMEIRHDYVAR